MATTSLKPIPAASFDENKARHLLSRAGFGGPPRQVAFLAGLGLKKAVDFLVDYESIDISALPKPQYDSDIVRPLRGDVMKMLGDGKSGDAKAIREKLRMEFLQRQAEDRLQMAGIEQWWLTRMIATPRPLEEKLVLLWHGHFASNNRTVDDSFLMLQQNVLFRKHANGNFGELVMGVIRDPAMLKFLNNNSNRKGHPNENLARELMELFTLGVGAYGENDIKQGARALTGYGVEDNDFAFHRNAHDEGQKEILGRKGLFDGEDFVRILLGRPQCPLFISYKLYRHFVGDIDEKPTDTQETVIRAMAKVLSDNRYELKPVLKTLFMSEHFYDPQIVGGMVKSPAQLLVGTARMLNTPARNSGTLAAAMSMMGQQLFEPPSVAGWDGGRGWINTSTLFVRQNLATYLITGKVPGDQNWSQDTVGYDPLFLLADLADRSPGSTVNLLSNLLLGEHAAAGRREELTKYLAARRGGITQGSVLAMLMLITAMPEYQLC